MAASLAHGPATMASSQEGCGGAVAIDDNPSPFNARLWKEEDQSDEGDGDGTQSKQNLVVHHFDVPAHVQTKKPRVLVQGTSVFDLRNDTSV